MDIQRYISAKAKGTVNLHQEDNAFFLDYDKFDPDTGEEVEPERLLLDKSEMQDQLSDLQLQVQFLSDLISNI